ncbi:MAG: phosphopantetheine-binding protein [Solirubrobacteraceae bacterium]|jgi:acyl carrier protein
MAEHSSEQIEKVITDSLVSFGANADDINREAELTALDIDSLDLAELSQIIEEQFGVELTSGDVAEIATVGDAIDLVAERTAGA